MESGLSHQGQKAGGLQGDGFTAGVGAGDDEQVVFLAQSDRDGHDLLRIQQRVAAFLNIDAPVFIEFRPGGLHILCQPRFGENEVESGQNLIILGQLFGAEDSLVA